MKEKINTSFCVADFEFSSNDNQILEIGAVKVFNNEIKSEFHCFIKQNGNKLTNLDKKITKLTNSQLENGISLEKALTEFYKFCDDNIIYTWSNSDKKILDINLNRINSKLSFDFHDGREEIFNKYTGFKRNLSVTDAINWVGEYFEGEKHNALNDAKNTATIFIKLNKLTGR